MSPEIETLNLATFCLGEMLSSKKKFPPNKRVFSMFLFLNKQKLL